MHVHVTMYLTGLLCATCTVRECGCCAQMNIKSLKIKVCMYVCHAASVHVHVLCVHELKFV